MDTISQEQADRIEGKLDRIIEFTEQAQAVLAGFANGAGAKLMAAMARGMGGGGR